MSHVYKISWLVLSSIVFIILTFGIPTGALVAGVVSLFLLGEKIL